MLLTKVHRYLRKLLSLSLAILAHNIAVNRLCKWTLAQTNFFEEKQKNSSKFGNKRQSDMTLSKTTLGLMTLSTIGLMEHREC
jgi:hypothetical protein